MQPHTLLHKKCWINLQCIMHAVISLFLQSRKLWWYLLLTSWMLLHDVIMTSYCCQWYAKCLVTTVCPSRTVHWHTAPRTCNSWTAASRNAKLSCALNLWPSNIQYLSPVDYEIWAVIQHHAYHRQIHSADELKRRLIDDWCSLEKPTFEEAIDQWRGRHRAMLKEDI